MKPTILRIFLILTFNIVYSQTENFQTLFSKYYEYYQTKDFYNASIWADKMVVAAAKEYGEGEMIHYNRV